MTVEETIVENTEIIVEDISLEETIVGIIQIIIIVAILTNTYNNERYWTKSIK